MKRFLVSFFVVLIIVSNAIADNDLPDLSEELGSLYGEILSLNVDNWKHIPKYHDIINEKEIFAVKLGYKQFNHAIYTGINVNALIDGVEKMRILLAAEYYCTTHAGKEFFKLRIKDELKNQIEHFRNINTEFTTVINTDPLFVFTDGKDISPIGKWARDAQELTYEVIDTYSRLKIIIQ